MKSVISSAVFAALTIVAFSFLPERAANASSAKAAEVAPAQVNAKIDARLHQLIARLAREAQAKTVASR